MEIQRKPPRDRGSMKKGDCDTMKKFLALILTLAMALSVTACGGSDDTADDTADGEGSGTEETADYASMTDDELKAARYFVQERITELQVDVNQASVPLSELDQRIADTDVSTSGRR